LKHNWERVVRERKGELSDFDREATKNNQLIELNGRGVGANVFE
jgi:hypothetical protein